MDDIDDNWLLEAVKNMESNQLGQKSEEAKKVVSPNREGVDLFADDDDDWLIEGADIVEADHKSKDVARAVASTSVQTTKEAVPPNREGVDLFADDDDDWLIEGADNVEADHKSKDVATAVASTSVQTTEEATTSNAGKTGKIKAKRNARKDTSNLHSRPRRSITDEVKKKISMYFKQR